MKKRYVYFVSVWYYAVHSVVYNMEIALDEPVTTIKQVREMQDKARLIMWGGYCYIINYQFLREETEQEQEKDCPAKVWLFHQDFLTSW